MVGLSANELSSSYEGGELVNANKPTLRPYVLVMLFGLFGKRPSRMASETRRECCDENYNRHSAAIHVEQGNKRA